MEIDKWYGRVRDPHVCKYRWASLSNIIDIQPVNYSESLSINLMLTTCNCERIYVALGTQEREVANSDAEIRELEKLGLQSDFLITRQIIRGEWEVISISDRLPETDMVIENEKLSEQVIHRPFVDHTLPRRNHKLLQHQNLLEMCHFDND